ncbi:MAG: hypothetical protein Q8O33_07790 [Pseudomonadota bacterium]|nr:hypothetical protein [Pseudomonadota bacterium]
MPRLDFRPAIQEPVYLILSRQQVESGDTQEPMVFLQHIVANPDHALEFMGRVSLIVDGYNDDARELFEVSEVRRYLKALDDQWAYWFFFLSQADDSIKILESCLCDTIEVIPGVASVDLEQMERSLTRHFTALSRLCEALAIPDEINQEISDGVIALIHNSAVQKIEADDYE